MIILPLNLLCHQPNAVDAAVDFFIHQSLDVWDGLIQSSRLRRHKHAGVTCQFFHCDDNRTKLKAQTCSWDRRSDKTSARLYVKQKGLSVWTISVFQLNDQSVTSTLYNIILTQRSLTLGLKKEYSSWLMIWNIRFCPIKWFWFWLSEFMKKN